MKVIQVKNKSVMDSIEDKKFKGDCLNTLESLILRKSMPDDNKSNETSDTDYTDVYKESINILHISVLNTIIYR